MKAIIFILSISACVFAKNPDSAFELELKDILLGPSSLEISGFVKRNQKLCLVSDNSRDTWLYCFSLKTKKINKRVEPRQVKIAPEVNLKSLRGFWPYYLKTLLSKQGGRWFKSPWDLEGAAACDDTIYLVNEQARHALKISNGRLEKLNIDFEKAFERFGVKLSSIPTNAGFEGVAADCKNDVLYIAQEREPRALIVIDLKTLKVTDMFQTSLKNHGATPDYSDLFFEDSFLYILERNAFRILKLNPQTKKVVAHASFKNLLKGIGANELYNTGKPFGLAEALYMDEDFVYIGNDNNGNPFSAKAKEFFDGAENQSSIMKFKRPGGF